MIYESIDGQSEEGYGSDIEDSLAKASLLLNHVSRKGQAVSSDDTFIGPHQQTEGLLENDALSSDGARYRRHWDITVPATDDEPALNAVLSARYTKPDNLDLGYPRYTALITGHDDCTDYYDTTSPEVHVAGVRDMSRIAETLVNAQAAVEDDLIIQTTEEAVSRKGLTRFFRRKSA